MKLKSRTFIFIVVSFVLGVIAGGVVGMRFLDGSKSRHRSSSQSEVMKEFSAKLRLDSLQISVIDSILEASRTRFNEVRKSYAETFRLRRDTLRLEIRKHLSEEQNKLYDEYIKEIEEREARWRRPDR